MFVPSRRSPPDDLEVELGPEHMLYYWREDVKLVQRWPSRKECREKGWNQKQRVALYHWVMLTSKEARDKVVIRVADTWRHPAAEFYSSYRIEKPLVLIRVNLQQRLSQYLGWVMPDKYAKIPVVNWAYNHKEHQKMRRVVMMDHLGSGFPTVERRLFA